MQVDFIDVYLQWYAEQNEITRKVCTKAAVNSKVYLDKYSKKLKKINK